MSNVTRRLKSASWDTWVRVAGVVATCKLPDSGDLMLHRVKNRGEKSVAEQPRAVDSAKVI